MEKIKLGILGMGNMGKGHLHNIKDGLCPSVELVAVCDIDQKQLDYAKENMKDVATYLDAIEMLDSKTIDSLLIAVPHYDHPTYAMEAFKRGIHVMTEKPAGVYCRQVREMNEAAERSGVKFGIMFNQRTNPLFAKAREIVSSGALGEPKRFVGIVTNWYRTQAYYNSGSWRATWNGEGGGVLLNQAPHNLDLWQWIFGVPSRIRAFCSFGKYHNIGVEDDVTIYGEYDNGATAVFISTTGETPGTNRFEISGDRGKIVIEDGKLKWWRLSVPERRYCFESKNGFVAPEREYEEFTGTSPEGHPVVLEAFASSILRGTELIADGREGLKSLSISNAALLSTWTDDWASIPTDEEAFEKHLRELCASEVIPEREGEAESIDVLRQRWKVRW